MLANQKMFDIAEQTLLESGQLESYFGDEPYRGRMMITEGDAPEGLGVNLDGRDVVFIATFDFCDCELGLALNPESREARSGIWITPQTKDAEPPDNVWAEFFAKTLMESIEEDGSYRCPIYSFVSDTKDLTVVPTGESV